MHQLIEHQNTIPSCPIGFPSKETLFNPLFSIMDAQIVKQAIHGIKINHYLFYQMIIPIESSPLFCNIKVSKEVFFNMDTPKVMPPFVPKAL